MKITTTEVSPDDALDDTSLAPTRVGRAWLRRDAIGIAACCLLVLVGFFEVAFLGKTFSTAAGVYGVNGPKPFEESPPIVEDLYRNDRGASAWQFEPWAEVVHRAYTDGDLPLWNPHQGAGAPLAANMQSAAFDPLLLPVNLHPTPLTWDLTFLAIFMLGAVATYLFARMLGLDIVPSVVASAGFSLSGYFFLYTNNHFAHSYVYLPVICLMVERVLRSPRLLPVFGLGLAVTGNLLVGMPEASVIVLGTCFAYALMRVIAARREVVVRTVAARLASGFVLGCLLASPLLLLLAEYSANSFSLHKPSDRLGQHVDPTRMLLNWFVPFFNGPPGRTPWEVDGMGPATG